MRDGDALSRISPARHDESSLNEQWTRVRARLQAEVGEVEYRTWLKQVALAGVAGDEVTVILPTRFLRDWVNKEYGELITAFWQAENPAIRNVEIRTGTQVRGTAPSLAEAPAPMQTLPPAAAAPAAPRPDSAAPLDQRFTFETFVVGKPNEFAYACARRVAEAPATPGFNPLFLYGGVGLGKTHLMHAIAWELSNRGNGRAPASRRLYVGGKVHVPLHQRAALASPRWSSRTSCARVDVLMIDDLQFLIGKDNTQEEFFHTFNALVDAGKQIVISADKSPSDLSGLEDRLRTRLGCGMVADLHATTFELRYSILEAKAQRAGVEVPAKVLEFLARKITSNNRELEGALNRLVAHANLFNRPLTMETAHEVLHDVLKAHDRQDLHPGNPETRVGALQYPRGGNVLRPARAQHRPP